MSRRTKIAAVVVAVLLLVPAVRFGAFTTVTTGTRLLCKYHHTIRQNIYKKVVPRWSAAQYGIMTTTITCQKHIRLEKLRAQALAALKNGDTATAKKLFEEIKRIDPTFADVNTQLDRINNNAGVPANPANPNAPAVPAIDLTTLLPASIDGYKSGEIDAGAGYATRNYRPSNQETVQSLQATVHALADQASAEQFITRVDRAGFAKNATETAINGYAAYFGTDGATYATLAWAKGAIVYEIQAHSSKGDPAGLEAEITALAASFN
jgi:hypothetical protein